MATQIIEEMQTYDMSTTAMEFVADGVHQISPVDTPLQMILPKVQVGGTNPKWIEDELTKRVSALSATISATDDLSITISTDDATDLFPEDVATYNSVIRIGQEAMLVTAITTATGVLTVTRGYQSTTAATHANAAVIHIISHMEHEGADGKKSWLKARTKPTNYLQTFSRTVEITGVQEAIQKLGGVTSEMNYQIMQTMRQLALELEKTIVFGIAAAAGDGSTSWRHMGGLWDKVSTNRTSDSGYVDTDGVEADIETIWSEGGQPTAIVCPGAMAQRLANIYEARIRTDVLSQIGGVNITTIINPLATNPIWIIPHRELAAGEYYMLDTSRIALGYLRPFHLAPLAKAGDTTTVWIGGDYTLQVFNEKSQAYRYGLTG